MEHISITFANGNAPYLRTTELALAVRELLNQEYGIRPSIVVPHVFGEHIPEKGQKYGNRQKRIMTEEFGDVIEQEPEAILLDPVQGELLHQVFYQEGTFSDKIRAAERIQEKVEEGLRNHVEGTYTVETFSGEHLELQSDDIITELSRNPQVRALVPKDRAFYTSPGRWSRILTESVGNKSIDLDELTLKTGSKIYQDIESTRGTHFLPEIGVFGYLREEQREGDEIFTPLLQKPPHTPENKDIKPGMYVTISGIQAVEDLYAAASTFGLRVYASPRANLEGANTDHPPSIIGHPAIQAHFARAGWGSIGNSLFGETPLIVSPYEKGDDPEIFFNNKTVEALGLGTIYDSDDPSGSLERARELIPNIQRLRQRTNEVFGTENGVEYAAHLIVAKLNDETMQLEQARSRSVWD